MPRGPGTWSNPMIPVQAKLTGKPSTDCLSLGLVVFLWLSIFCCGNLPAAEPSSVPNTNGPAPGYNVQTYVVQGKALLATNLLVPLFAKYTGTNVSIEEIVHAAADLQTEYRNQGYLMMNIVIAPKRIAKGVVTLDVFPGAVAQIVVAGKRYLISGNGVETASNPATGASGFPASVAATNAPAPEVVPPIPQRNTPATPEEMAQAQAAMKQKMADLAAREKDTRIHVVSTNAGPRFAVEKYLITGNTVLPPASFGQTLTNIDGAFGTNVSLDGIRAAVTQLQNAYRERGYVTVVVGLPPQKLTNATVTVRVTEGRLATIEVKGNQYFSSNNVMRALPSLHTNMILNRQIFEAELNRANANQDRQIYPVIEPGPDPGTSDLALKVKDRLPLHAKVELNNQSTPGTPELRLNSSAVYNNLWQHENSFGVQYGFSPENYKLGNQWHFYDVPLVANYSAFYRMPLGNPVSIEEVIAGNPDNFGYNEATRKFNLPPATGQPELNVYASRSAIDTGLETLSSSTLYNVPGVRTITQNNVQQDLTVNNDLGARLSAPVEIPGNFHSDFSGGLDFKTYETTSSKTNNFKFAEITVNAAGIPNPPVYSTVASPVPITDRSLEYLPLSVSYNLSWHAPDGNSVILGLGLAGNAWYSGSSSNLQGITSSTQSSGHWVTLNPSFSWRFPIHTNWMTTLRADGQWTSEPLISNEQFGAGGVNSVRGYHEGEVFGDTGWHVSLEQQTPPHVVGTVYGGAPLTLRGSIYMDFAKIYLLDPQGRPDSTALWGTGFGGVASIGSQWEARLLFSVPLLKTTTTEAYQPFFNFSLTAQF